MAKTTKTTKTASKASKTADKIENAFENAFDQAGFELPSGVRELAEQGVDQAKVVYGRFRDGAQDAVDMMDESTTALKDGGTEINLKLLDFAQTNVLSGFDFARSLLAARDVKQVVELQTAFAREQGKAITEQSKELSALYAKLAENAARPLKDGVAKSVENVRNVIPA